MASYAEPTSAVQSAIAMQRTLRDHNRGREVAEQIHIRIGINAGPGLVETQDVFGDVVNVAARVEGLTKDLGRKIVITESVVDRMGEGFHFEPLGSHKVKGHSPVSVWGIRTTRPASAQQGAGA